MFERLKSGLGWAAWGFLVYITMTLMGSPNHEDAWIFVLGVPFAIGVAAAVVETVVIWVRLKITG
jgi:hypothetical protein